jgi:hypothetical protein
MAELSLSRAQIRTIASIAAEKDKGGIDLVCPPENAIYDQQYVEVRVNDEYGELVEAEVLTWAGTRPNFDGRYLEGAD